MVIIASFWTASASAGEDTSRCASLALFVCPFVVELGLLFEVEFEDVGKGADG